jgi:hypothetical protein
MRAGFLSKRKIDAILMDDAGKYTTPFAITLPTRNLIMKDIVLTPTPSDIIRGGTVSLGGTFVDASTDDQHTVTINWGDGTANSKLSLPKGKKSFTSDHQFAAALLTATQAFRDFPIKVTLADYTKLPPAYTALYVVHSTLNFRVWNYLRRADHALQQQTPSVGSWIGAGTYSAAGAGQAVDLGTIGASLTTTFLVRVTNTGSLSDTFAVKGTCDTANYTATVFDAATGGNNVTAQVSNLTTGWQFTLAKDASRTYRVVFQLKAAAPEGVAQTLLLTAASLTTNDTPRIADAVDGVQIIATRGVAAAQRPDVKAKTASTAPYTGEAIYSDTGDGQQSTIKIEAGKTATYIVRVQNDGTETDSILITAAETAHEGWLGTRAYLQGLSGTTPVPATITTSGWLIGPLAPGAGVDFRVQVIPDVSMASVTPAYTIMLTAVSQGNATARDVMGLVTSTMAALQPDMMIKKYADSADVGQNIYNADGTNQTVSTLMPLGTNIAKYRMRIQNDGMKADTFKLTAPATTATGWTVKYYLDASNTDITAQITGSGWLTPELARLAYCEFIRIEVDGTASLRGRAVTVTVTGTSVTIPTLIDVVKATTTKG